MKLFLILAVAVASTVGVPVQNAVTYDNDLNWRIVGGDTAPAGAYPYMVSLRGWTGQHSCGGAILNQFYIITAAHCVYGADPFLFDIVVGTNTLDRGGTVYYLRSFFVYPEFNPNSLQHDIALAQVASVIEFTPYVAPVTLSARLVGSNEYGDLSGWGTLVEGGSVPNNLQYITLRTISGTECAARLNPNPTFTDSQICTLNVAGHGACRGDSGSPLVIDNEVVGIVSWGIPCALGYPDVFARVFFYRDWIRSITGI